MEDNMMIKGSSPQCLEDDDDQIGTNPINLPDPSLFSDFHENENEYISGSPHDQSRDMLNLKQV